MATTPGLISRQPNRVDLLFLHTDDVTAWRLSASDTLTGAFSSTTAFLTVERGFSYRSVSLRKRGIRIEDTSQRKGTRVLFDPADFEDPGNNIPGDTFLWYIRVEERNAAGVWRPKGPIWILPTSDFFAVEAPSLILAGTAPAAALGARGTPPAGAMHVVMPRPVGTVVISNTGGDILKIGTNPGQPMTQTAAGSETTLFDADDRQFFFCVDHASNTTTFTAYVILTNGVI